MKIEVFLSLLLVTAMPALRADTTFDGKNANPFVKPLSDGVRLSPRLVENIYCMPEQVTKLIFPKPVDEVSVNTQVISITRNSAESKENYLLLSPKVGKADVNMHIVMEGTTYTFRIIVGREMVNYRKTYTLERAGVRNLPRVPALAPSEIHTVNLLRMVDQVMREPNYADIVQKDLTASPQGRNYLWNGLQITLQDAWHYLPQDVIILRIEVHNPSSQAAYLSATQVEPYIANRKLPYLLTEQGTKVLLPGQTDIKYLFLQGYGIDIEHAAFELRLPATGEQLRNDSSQ